MAYDHTFCDKRIYNIASKFVQSNSIARACFIFLLCTLMTSANKCLENSVSDFLHFAFKNGRNLQQNVELQMKTREPADEEALPTFSSGLEFLTPEKNLKKRKKRTRSVTSCLAKLLIFRRQFRFLRGKRHLFETIN